MRPPLHLALALAACSGDVTVVLPSPPAGASQRSMVLALETADVLEVFAVGPDPAPIRSSRAFEAGTQIHLRAFRYDAELDALGLSAGPVESSTSARGAALPPTDAPLLGLELVAGEAPGGWDVADELGPRLAGFRVEPPRGGCVDLRPQIRPLGTMRKPVLLAELEADAVLVGTENESFLRLTRDSRETVAGPIYQGYTSSFRQDDGALWLGSYGGDVAKVRMNGGQLEMLERQFGPTSEHIYWVSGDPSGSGPDLFFMDVAGGVFHYDGDRVERAYESPGGKPEIWTGGVARVGPEEAVVAWNTVLGLTRLRRDELTGQWLATQERTPGVRAGFTSIRHLPGFGTVGANAEGQFYVYRGGEWKELPESPSRLWIMSIAPYEGGFVYGTAFGNVGQYVEGRGFCPLVPHAIADDVRQVLSLGSGDVVVIGRSGVQAPALGWLEH